MLVNGNDILLKAREEHYGVGAFNVNDYGAVEAILGAAEETMTPVIIQIGDWTDPNAAESKAKNPWDAQIFMDFVRNRAEVSPVPVCIHLDHCRTFEGCIRSIKLGATSVMIDASMCSFEENIALTKKVIEAVRGANVTVEAEIGHVDGHAGDTTGKLYTTVEEAKRFYEETGVDSLAVAIGTVHGIYAEEPVLQYDRISELREAIPAPLVMHGASGLEPEQYKECVKRGITKINFATYMQLAGAHAIEKLVKEAGDQGGRFQSYYAAGVAGMREIVKQHIGYFQTKRI